MEQKKKKFILLSTSGVLIIALIAVLLVIVLKNPTPIQRVNEDDSSYNSSDESSTDSDTSSVTESENTDSENTGSEISSIKEDNTEKTQTKKRLVTKITKYRKKSESSVSNDNGTDNSSSGSESGSNDGENDYSAKIYNLIRDNDFSDGFWACDLDQAKKSNRIDAVLIQPYVTENRAAWDITQWYSKVAFNDPKYSTPINLGNGIFKIASPENELIVDKANKYLSFTCKTSQNTNKYPRTSGDQSWQHLLIEQTFSKEAASLANKESMILHLSTKLKYFKNNRNGLLNNNEGETIGAAQFLMYFTIHSKKDSGFIWFGFPLFDDRYGGYSSGLEDGKSAWDPGTRAKIVSVGTNDLYGRNKTTAGWQNGKLYGGDDAKWATINCDILPQFKKALENVQTYTAGGQPAIFTNSTVDDLYIGSMNMGWEMPGYFDASMEIEDFSLMVTRK